MKLKKLMKANKFVAQKDVTNKYHVVILETSTK
jgi:hypothetical protein